MPSCGSNVVLHHRWRRLAKCSRIRLKRIRFSIEKEARVRLFLAPTNKGEGKVTSSQVRSLLWWWRHFASEWCVYKKKKRGQLSTILFYSEESDWVMAAWETFAQMRPDDNNGYQQIRVEYYTDAYRWKKNPKHFKVNFGRAYYTRDYGILWYSILFFHQALFFRGGESRFYFIICQKESVGFGLQ